MDDLDDLLDDCADELLTELSPANSDTKSRGPNGGIDGASAAASLSSGVISSGICTHSGNGSNWQDSLSCLPVPMKIEWAMTLEKDRQLQRSLPQQPPRSKSYSGKANPMVTQAVQEEGTELDSSSNSKSSDLGKSGGNQSLVEGVLHRQMRKSTDSLSESLPASLSHASMGVSGLDMDTIMGEYAAQLKRDLLRRLNADTVGRADIQMQKGRFPTLSNYCKNT